VNAPNLAVWRGTAEEKAALDAALERHCRCVKGPDGVRVVRCAVHALLRDQHALDRLLFYRRLRDRLVAEEATPSGPAAAA
jgi:hypothetical protein